MLISSGCFSLCIFQELKQKFVEQSQVNCWDFCSCITAVDETAKVQRSCFVSLYWQALAEAQKGKEHALVDSVSTIFVV